MQIVPNQPTLATATPRTAGWLARVVVCVGLALVGCTGEATAPVCRVDADCASGRCLPSGLCDDYRVSDAGADVQTRFGDAGSDASAGSDTGGNGGDAGSVGTDTCAADSCGGGADAGGGFVCQPNHDGKVVRAEIHFAAGLSAPFKVARDAAFDAKGQADATAGTVWDLRGPYDGDKDMKIGTIAVQGAWFEKDFVGATYATQLDTDSPLLGVFEATGDKLLMRGLVSPASSLYETLLVYDPPAIVLSFPLEAGTSFQSSSTVKGKKDGILSYWTESWVSSVDAKGAVQTPYGNFPALRVRTTLTRQIGVFTYISRSLSWVTECFGTVALARSKLDETEPDFPVAEELRRLTPP